MNRNFKVGDIVIYENRTCRITELTASSATLYNLSPKDASDWIYLQVQISNIKEDTNNE